MSPREREHCFDPFFTTKQESGTGLGLAAAQGTIERHGGRITVESQQGRGATFRIVLPAAEGPERPEAAQEVGAPVKPLKILVVEDEAEQRDLLIDYLSMDDHRVEVASDGQEGLRMFMDGYYDLVITDRSMPQLGGDQLVAALKDEAPGKPVIMLTGFGDMMEAAREEVEGVDLVLPKPVGLEDVREAVAKVMGWGTGN